MWLAQLGQHSQGETIRACASAVLDNQSIHERYCLRCKGTLDPVCAMLRLLVTDQKPQDHAVPPPLYLDGMIYSYVPLLYSFHIFTTNWYNLLNALTDLKTDLSWNNNKKGLPAVRKGVLLQA